MQICCSAFLLVAGGGHAHNVGASLLTVLGLQDGWLADTQVPSTRP